MGFASNFNKVVEENNLGGFIERPRYGTGIDFIDYSNGSYDRDGNLSVGICGGKVATWVGGSGGGKSTCADQCAINIVKAFQDDGVFKVWDAEKGATYERLIALGAFEYGDFTQNWQEKAISIVNERTNSDALFRLISDLHVSKLEYFTGAKFTKKDGIIRSAKGEAFREKLVGIPPSIILVDSWAMMPPEKIADEEDMNGNMAAATIAKANNGLIKKITDKLYEANIMLWTINHILTDIQTGYVQEDKRPLKWLKMNETIPGGKEAIYVADYLMRLDQKERFKKEEGFCIEGFTSEGTILKSRSNASGLKIPFVFEQRTGINNFLTNFNYLKEVGGIQGAGKSWYLGCYPSVKFAQKDAVEVYNNDKNFRKAFNDTIAVALTSLITQFKGMEDNSGMNQSSEISISITPELIQEASLKELKEICKNSGLTIEWKDYPGEDGLATIKDTLITQFEDFFGSAG